jgi:cysteinyl-tRNA synthetase
MALLVYNTLTRKKEEFKPIKDKTISMFVCGSTVYDDAHLGHAKAYVDFDFIVRWFRHLGYKVHYAQNITDIDDKIIARANERGIDPTDLAREYEKRLLEDMSRLRVKEDVDEYPRSMDYIKAMEEQIQILIDKGYAYYVDGDIYYDVSKFKDYTNISGMKLSELEKHRTEPKEGKRNIYDFALWKAAKPGEPQWEITLKIDGKEVKLSGRPGWHIEDTAMTWKIFGPTYDLHGGAIELLFPHHTNEIAQAEAAFGIKPFVKYWMHCGVLSVNDSKMSKSLKNFVTIREALSKYSPEALRVFFASTHYRKDVNYKESTLAEALRKLRFMYSSFGIFYNMGEMRQPTRDDGAISEAARKFVADFTEAMDNDFNTSLALSKLVDFIGKLRSFAESHTEIGEAAKKEATNAVLGMAGIFGILQEATYKEKMPVEADALIKKREALRKAKKFEEADALREELRKRYDIILEDTSYGPVWYKGEKP